MKKLLELKGDDGLTLFIDASSIIAIEESNQRNLTAVYCKGILKPFLVKAMHQQLFLKLKELELAELVRL